MNVKENVAYQIEVVLREFQGKTLTSFSRRLFVTWFEEFPLAFFTQGQSCFMVRCPQKRSFDVETFFLDLSFLRHDEVSVCMPSRVILDELTQIPGQYYLNWTERSLLNKLWSERLTRQSFIIKSMDSSQQKAFLKKKKQKKNHNNITFSPERLFDNFSVFNTCESSRVCLANLKIKRPFL